MATFESIKTILNGREVIFRSLIPSDAASLLKFRAQVPHDSTHTMQYVGMKFPSLEETQKQLQTQQEQKVTLSLAAFDGDDVVGFLNIRMERPDHPWAQHLGQFGMMVLKDYWGFGIGRKLLELQEIHAKRNGITRIEALVRIKNERGLRLYQSCGFKIEGTRRKAANIDGELQDEYFIAKLLDEDSIKSWTPPTLTTARLILRAVQMSDAPAIFEYAKNPNMCRYTLWEAHQSVKDSEAYIKDYILPKYAQGVPEPIGITLKSNPEKLIGTVGCFWVSQPSKCMELAYAISEDYWGQGLMSEAALATIDYCFQEFSVKRIQARCKIENEASARVMEKIGMQFEGTLKSSFFHRGQYWDMHYYAKVK